LNLVVAGQWTVLEAAAARGLSERQVRRLLTAYEGGGGALPHGNRGRAPAHTVPAVGRQPEVALARDKSAGFH
jgi:hypothetical protein